MNSAACRFTQIPFHLDEFGRPRGRIGSSVLVSVLDVDRHTEKCPFLRRTQLKNIFHRGQVEGRDPHPLPIDSTQRKTAICRHGSFGYRDDCLPPRCLPSQFTCDRARIGPKFWHTSLVHWKFYRAIFDVHRPQTSLNFVCRMSVDGQLA